jgi:hypothetical protein
MKYQIYLPHGYDFNVVSTIFYLYEKFENTKLVIISPKSKKEIQCSGQIKRNKRANNDLNNTIQITNELAARAKQNTGGELKCSGRAIRSHFTCGTGPVNLATNH